MSFLRWKLTWFFATPGQKDDNKSALWKWANQNQKLHLEVWDDLKNVYTSFWCHYFYISSNNDILVSIFLY